MNPDSSSAAASFGSSPAAYRATVTGRFGGGEAVFLGLRTTGLDVEFDDGVAFHYDGEGRLAKVATPNVQWRRGLSHQTVRLRKRRPDEGGGLEKQLLDRQETDRLVERARGRLGGLLERWRQGSIELTAQRPADGETVEQIQRALRQAAAFDLAAARADLGRFERLYGHVPILPPDQYGALVLMATEGCRYNQCTFCGLYRNDRFRARTPAEFLAHVQAAERYHGRGLAGRRNIFLGQANALIGTPAWRREIFEIVNRQFEFPAAGSRPSPEWWLGWPRRFVDITAFLDAFPATAIDAGQFAELRRLHLGSVTLGVESGDPKLLKWLRKPAVPARVLRTVAAARQGGVRVGVVILVGAGGERFFDSHVEQTVKLVRAMRLGRGDKVFFSALVDLPGTEYHRYAEADAIEPLSPARLAEQQRQLRTALAAAGRPHGPYLAPYDVRHFVY